MSNESDEKAFIQAAELAKKVPKHLQEVAFNRALDHLLGTVAKSKSGLGWEPPATTAEPGKESELFSRIDRTKYPDVGSTPRVADRALKLLQLANEDHGVDGLTAQEISDILTRKFRLPVTPNAVNIALDRETDTVNVRQLEGVKRFHIMAPGEDYLKRLAAGEVAGVRRRRSGVSARIPRTRAPKAEKAARKNGEAGTERKRRGSRPGPKAAVTQLLGQGFFKAARTISEVQEELKHSRGHTYSLQELAPALVRSLRDQKLQRKRNAEGQYEYSEA